MQIFEVQGSDYSELLQKKDKAIASAYNPASFICSSPAISTHGYLKSILYFHQSYKEASGQHLTKDSHPDDREWAKDRAGKFFKKKKVERKYQKGPDKRKDVY